MPENRYHHGNLRAALIDATRRLLLDRDPESLSLRQAAREVGVSANAPYRHFEDKDALLGAVAAEGFRVLMELIRDSANGTETSKRLEAIGVAYCQFVAREPGLVRVMFGPRLRAAKRHPGLDEAERGAFAELAAAVDAVEPSTSPEDGIRNAVGLWSVMHGYATLRADGAFGFLDAWMLPSAADLVSYFRRVGV
ncbi:MAG: TetR/AcrR family transcriptional regulator [Gemmatimonadales bacterium]